MNFDDIIPFIIFLVYIAFMVFRKKPQKKTEKADVQTSQSTEKKKGFGLSTLVDTIKAELEKAAMEARQRQEAANEAARKEATAWDDLADHEYDEEDDEDPDREAERRPARPTAGAPPLNQPPPVSAPTRTRYKDTAVHKKTAPVFSYDQKTYFRKRLVLTPAKMREAVVLSELLAKPIALRK